MFAGLDAVVAFVTPVALDAAPADPRADHAGGRAVLLTRFLAAQEFTDDALLVEVCALTALLLLVVTTACSATRP